MAPEPAYVRLSRRAAGSRRSAAGAGGARVEQAAGASPQLEHHVPGEPGLLQGQPPMMPNLLMIADKRTEAWAGGDFPAQPLRSLDDVLGAFDRTSAAR